MSPHTIEIETKHEGFYQLDAYLNQYIKSQDLTSGVLTVFCPHTSCGILLNESYDPSAKEDMENFLKHLAPRNLHFIKHTAEGEDDSPAHMKTVLIQSSISLIIEDKELLIGKWQGIFLAEFRDRAHTRKIILKFIEG